ncbi:MAG TPA: hypothetical protein VN442_24690 [Bryobacteraceae bacterium]|nr:hypothetical protein [Bryobacteraceae bacterium]
MDAVTPTAAAGMPQAPESGKLAAVARDFEALLVSELLKTARAAGSEAWLGGEDAAADSAFGLAEQQFSRAIADAGGLGLARLITRGLEDGATRSSSVPPAPAAERP